MRKRAVSSLTGLALTAIMTTAILVGCGRIEEPSVEIVEDEVPGAAFIHAGYVKALRSDEDIIPAGYRGTEVVAKRAEKVNNHEHMDISDCTTFTNIVEKLVDAITD